MHFMPKCIALWIAEKSSDKKHYFYGGDIDAGHTLHKKDDGDRITPTKENLPSLGSKWQESTNEICFSRVFYGGLDHTLINASRIVFNSHSICTCYFNA